MEVRKTLYITDLDGTILDKNQRVPEKSISILNRLIENGLLLSYATARSIVSSSDVTEGLHITAPVITSNGVSIVDPITRKVLHTCSFDKEELQRLIEYIRKYDIYPLVFSYVNGVEKCSYVKGKETEGMIRFLNLPVRKKDPRMNPVDSFDNLFQGDVFYISCIGGEHTFDEISGEVDAERKFKWFLAPQLYNLDYWFEIMPLTASKANAIRILQEMLGCDRVVCFGDAVNDISMFQNADACYAVGNAVEELKAIATGVIGSNEEDGVAKWLEKNFIP